MRIRLHEEHQMARWCDWDLADRDMPVIGDQSRGRKTRPWEGVESSDEVGQRGGAHFDAMNC